jgi:hypothetical protein
VIGLDVSLEDMRDAHRLLRCRLDVRLDLGLWIHHSAARCAPSPEQIAGAAGLRNQEVTEDHWGPSFVQCVVDTLTVGAWVHKVQYRVLILEIR